MQMTDIPFGTTDWSKIESTEHKGDTGVATWRTRTFGTIRVRMVEYSPGYLADHWCTKGHILLCLKGELHTELADGRTFTPAPGHELSGRRRGRAAPVPYRARRNPVHRGLGKERVEIR